MFNMALAGSRDENPYVDHKLVQDDVRTLYRAGPGKIGTVCLGRPERSKLRLQADDNKQDEIAICGILLSRSDAHLQAIAQAFPQQHRVGLSQM